MPGARNVEPSPGYEAGCGKHYQVKVTSQVPGTMWLLFAILLPLAIPAIATVRWMTFESKRWKNSDHPWGED